MSRLDLSRIRALIETATESGAAEVEIEEKGVRIVVRQQSPQVMLPVPYAMPMPAAQPIPGAVAPPPEVIAAPDAQAPRPSAQEKVPEVEPAAPEGTTVRAPIVGTFFRSPSPEADPFVDVGSRVAVGDTLCIIEAMKNMNEIESEVAGTIKEVLVANAEAVSYDQPLFVVD